MQDAKTEEVFERFLKVIGAKTDIALAQALGVSPQSISDARKKNKIPPAWAIAFANKYQVSLDWLLLGQGFMLRKDMLTAYERAKTPPTPHIDEELLKDVLIVLEEFLEEEEKQITVRAKAVIACQLYELMVEKAEAAKSPLKVLQFIRRAVASNE